MVVSSVETTKKWIYDKISTGTKYDFKSRQYDFVSSETGQKIDFESIKPNMIISMAENGNYTYALVTNTVIRGEISGRSKDGTKVYAIIDGITYEISNAVNSSENLYVGNEVEMYLDFKDTIVYCASNEFKGRKLAYMISHGTTRSNLDPRAQIKILDQSGKITILDFANKVSFNNQTGIKDQVLIDSALNNVSNIFMYTLNDEGKINKVYYPKDGEDSGIYNYFNNATGSLQYSNTNKTLGKSIFVDQNATIFKIPSSSFVGATEEDYTIATRDSLRDSLSYTVLASYTSKEDSIASDIILMEYNVTSIGYNYLPVMLITKKANAIDEEGEQVDVLYGVSSKGEEVKYIGQNGKFSGCNVGDIVKLESADGIVKMAPIVGYDAENDVVNGFNSQSNSIQKGVILQRENALIKFYLGNTPSSPALSDIKLYDLDGAKISLYDKAAKRATDTTLEELKDYESFADSTQEVIILANDKEKAYWVIIFE